MHKWGLERIRRDILGNSALGRDALWRKSLRTNGSSVVAREEALEVVAEDGARRGDVAVPRGGGDAVHDVRARVLRFLCVFEVALGKHALARDSCEHAQRRRPVAPVDGRAEAKVVSLRREPQQLRRDVRTPAVAVQRHNRWHQRGIIILGCCCRGIFVVVVCTRA